MSFMDSLKSVVNTVTGGSATVTIQLQQACVFPGEAVSFKITAKSNGADVKSKGVYVDIFAEEKVSLRDEATKVEINRAKTTIQQTIQVAPAFTLAPSEVKEFAGSFEFPSNALPTFVGAFTHHRCLLRGRIEAFGNDPDSGYQAINIGAKH